MIERFREATQKLHEQIEEQNQAKKIMDHSIGLEEYKILLLQNYIAYRTAEKWISLYLPYYEGSKHEQLEKDLQGLNVDISIASEYETWFSCKNQIEALGAAYVVEGSVMGGMVISREVKKCEHLAGIEEHHFFSGDRDNVKAWKKFKKALDSREYSEEEIDQATEKAKDTFRFFQKVFLLSRSDAVLGI